MPTQSTASRQDNDPADGRTDFDFFFGRWNVGHRRLRKRLAGDTNWDVFGGTCEVHPILGGLGNVDDNLIELPASTYRAATLRTFDPATRQWSIWWIDGRNPLSIDVPVRGSFEAGVGTFLCEDVLDGRPIRVRFTLVADHRQVGALGAGLFTGWRQDMGNQLDHGVRPPGMSQLMATF